jgi:hypothetical protein
MLAPDLRITVCENIPDRRTPLYTYSGPRGYVRRSSRRFRYAVLMQNVVSVTNNAAIIVECLSLRESKVSAEKEMSSVRINDPRCLAGTATVYVVEIEVVEAKSSTKSDG